MSEPVTARGGNSEPGYTEKEYNNNDYMRWYNEKITYFNLQSGYEECRE